MSFMHFDESMKILNEQQIGTYKMERRPLLSARGYILAEDIVAEENSPEAPTSGMDGYAVRHEDLALGRLKISGINPAGNSELEELRPGEAIKTFTGSLMPPGSDTLIPIENVTVEGDEIIIDEPVPYGFSVRPVGENYVEGERLIAAGTPIDYPQIGVLSSLNRCHVTVYAKPRVAILATGSELLELGEPQSHTGQIRSSNNYTIGAIVERYGAEAIHMGCVGDDRKRIAAAVDNALVQADIVVSTGGVSVGDFDFVKDVVYALDAEVLFKGVRIKPGQHIMVARRGDQFIVALPGFAYSSTVTALLYVVPLIMKLQNTQNPIERVRATLREPFKKRSKKAEFTACNLRLESGEYFVDFQGKKSGTSAILTNMLGPVGLLYTSEDEGDKDAGETVEVLKIL
ncbi:molybdopterin molybdotransferase MoeA [Nitratifractor salsuginis]|uniref:Molybdopterin molybdenumtransferase n=1 Tax=Nitratifractor salsuginis (strain DSM 16511 / JCM 12458 / E9I37-1) TaxID=749222 RepID=E6X2U3_NITSE|nr:molybdopterin molybdotransferase MoeA [Nitratifractor salsuginis]ADV47226.1 molybdenum cofactor synthesis domain protein [Nitratifractor salsuginis DSM 16511]